MEFAKVTPQQKKSLQELREGQVQFPPLFDMGDGKLGVVLVESFSGKGFGLPLDIELKFAVIYPNGQVADIADARYVRR